MEHHRNVVEAGEAADARRLLYTSHIVATLLRCSHLCVTMPLRSDLESVRSRFHVTAQWVYAGSGMMLLGQGLATGAFSTPEDGPVHWPAHS